MYDIKILRIITSLILKIMVLIADGGSTKTSWSIFIDNVLYMRFETEGYNPFYVTEDYIIQSLKIRFGADFNFQEVNTIFFYGAGCEGDKDYLLKNALAAVFPNATSEVHSDLIGAAKALIGNGSGMVSILGTGMNTCVMNDGVLIEQIDGLGFYLGDEGSGGYLGRKLLKKYARKGLSNEISEKFQATYGLLPSQILKSFYDHPLQNKYAASFTTFLYENLYDDQVLGIVKDGFSDFFRNVIMEYKNHDRYELNCVGSIAFVFQDILKNVASDYDISLGKILKSPMDGLSYYHFPNTN